MAHQNLNRKNPSPSDVSSNSVPLCLELPIDEGAWLKIEGEANFPGINQKICKRALVLLHVTLEDSEHECSLAPYCKNHPIQKCMKDQEQTNGKINAF